MWESIKIQSPTMENYDIGVHDGIPAHAAGLVATGVGFALFSLTISYPAPDCGF